MKQIYKMMFSEALKELVPRFYAEYKEGGCDLYNLPKCKSYPEIKALCVALDAIAPYAGELDVDDPAFFIGYQKQEEKENLKKGDTESSREKAYKYYFSPNLDNWGNGDFIDAELLNFNKNDYVESIKQELQQFIDAFISNDFDNMRLMVRESFDRQINFSDVTHKHISSCASEDCCLCDLHNVYHGLHAIYEGMKTLSLDLTSYMLLRQAQSSGEAASVSASETVPQEQEQIEELPFSNNEALRYELDSIDKDLDEFKERLSRLLAVRDAGDCPPEDLHELECEIEYLEQLLYPDSDDSYFNLPTD